VFNLTYDLHYLPQNTPKIVKIIAQSRPLPMNSPLKWKDNRRRITGIRIYAVIMDVMLGLILVYHKFILIPW